MWRFFLVYTMAYSQINPDALKVGINPADRNGMALAAGYTGWDDYNDQQGRMGGGSSSGFDLNAGVNKAAANRSDLTSLFGTQRGEDADYLARYRAAIAAMPSTASLAKSIGGELGIDALRGNAQNLNNTLFQIPGTYTKATTGFGVNANQLSRIIGTKQTELAPSAALAAQNAQAAEGNLNTRLGYEKADQERALLPFEKESSMLETRHAREATGYTTAMQGELDAIIAKMNAGVTLSEGEKNRANQLSIAEKGYSNQLELAKLQNKNNYMTVGEGSTVIDPATGKVIYKSPKSGTGAANIGAYLTPKAPAAKTGSIGTAASTGGKATTQAPSYFKVATNYGR